MFLERREVAATARERHLSVPVGAYVQAQQREARRLPFLDRCRDLFGAGRRDRLRQTLDQVLKVVYLRVVLLVEVGDPPIKVLMLVDELFQQLGEPLQVGLQLVAAVARLGLLHNNLLHRAFRNRSAGCIGDRQHHAAIHPARAVRFAVSTLEARILRVALPARLGS